MEEKLKALEILRTRNLRDANYFHQIGEERVEEICRAKAEAYKNAIDILNETLVIE